MKTWIKLYTEILSDPKMGRMSDKLFRRTIELFLLAGKEDTGGTLPSVDDIAWSLHITQKEVRSILTELCNLNIVTKESEIYRISHFSDRQNSDLSRSEINHRYYVKNKQNKSDSKTEIQTNVRRNSDLRQSEIQTVEEEVEVEEEKEEKINTLTNVSVYAPAKKTPAKPKPEKHTYGSFGNVLLTDAEAENLRKKFTDADQRIEYFSTKKKAKGYVYKSDYAAILAWADDDAEKAKANGKAAQKTVNEYPDIYTQLKAEGVL